MSEVPEPILVALQQGLPLCPRPFAAAAQALGISEETLLEHAAKLLETGTARRLGGIFDSRRMGFTTALCAARIEFPTDEPQIAELIEDPHITHCYERGNHEAIADLQGDLAWNSLPNLWFTYGAEQTAFDAGLARARRLLGPAEVLVLPAIRHFRTHVILGRQAPSTASPAMHTNELPPLSETERRVVQVLQGTSQLCPEFYQSVAAQVGISRDQLLATLQDMVACGRLKRVALVLRHRSAGYAANAMCGWHIAPAQMAEMGRELAESPCVTHCYERPPSAMYPFNLYAMMHARTWREFRKGYGKAVEHLGLSGGILMCSLREFKKTSPVYA